jgi:hypothetical protein
MNMQLDDGYEDDVEYSFAEDDSAPQEKTRGELDYEEDVRKRPVYHDGGRRPAWERLPEIAKWSWRVGLVRENWFTRASWNML